MAYDLGYLIGTVVVIGIVIFGVYKLVRFIIRRLK